MFEELKADVYAMMSEQTAHEKTHIERVISLALNFGMKEGADLKLVELIALLHDVDDYKFTGIEQSKDLPNAKCLLRKHKIAPDICEKALHGLQAIGYSKRLDGITPDTIEAKVVSDADMCDIAGISGILRLKELADARNVPFFNPNLWPNLGNVTSEEYRKNAVIGVQHIFEKVLRLEKYMMTPSGLDEYLKRREASVDFCHHLFREEHEGKWERLLSEVTGTILPKRENEYAICLMFTPDMEHVVLQGKEKFICDEFLNGIGGKVEENETPEECVLRKIRKEAGITELGVTKWLGTLTIPYEERGKGRTERVLHFYAGIVEEAWDWSKRNMLFYKTDNILNDMKLKLAGNEDVKWFIQKALKTLKN